MDQRGMRVEFKHIVCRFSSADVDELPVCNRSELG